MPQTDPRLESRAEPAHETSANTAPLAPVLALPIIEMARFRRLMNYEGWEVDLPRMCIDTAYAHQCLATAHTSSDGRLRQAALQLFTAYDRNSTRLPVMH